MEGERVPAGDLFGGESITGSEWEDSNYAGEYGIRGEAFGRSQKPFKGAGSWKYDKNNPRKCSLPRIL